MSSRPRSGTGLVLPGATVALTPARAVTSHLRRRYHEKYRGRYRFSKLVFGIDMVIVGLVLAVFGIGVWFALYVPPAQTGIQLTLQAPPITTATTIAFEAHISAQDGKAHSDVRLRWILPTGTEIVSATPIVDNQTEAMIGDLKPGEEQIARIAVRLFVPAGSTRIGFEVRSDQDTVLNGYETLPVIGSALHIEPVLSPVRAVPQSDIYKLENTGNSTIDCARIQTDGQLLERMDAQAVYHYPSPQGSQMTFDAIAPGEERFFRAERYGSGMHLSCGPVELQSLPFLQPLPTSFIAPVEAYTSSTAPGLFASTPGQETKIFINATEPLRVLVYHPQLIGAQSGFRWFDVASGSTQLVLPLDAGKPVPILSDGRIPRWFVWLTRTTSDGYDLLEEYDGPITTNFSLETSARYYATSGGQIGAGPLPPEVGKTTRYWVQWKLAPTQADLSNVEMRATLAPGVKWNGMKALPNGGELTQEGNDLVWRLPFLPSSDADTSVTFALELTPTTEMRNTTPLLLQATRAQALENRSSVEVQGQADSLDTSLPSDELAKGKGMVK